MKNRLLISLLTACGLLAPLALPLAAQAQTPFTVTARSPARNARAAALATPVGVTFSAPLDAATAGNIRVFSQQYRGRRTATVSTSGATATLTPTVPATGSQVAGFKPGETLFVTVPASVQSTGGAAAVKQVYQFTTAVGGTGRGNFQPNSRAAVGSNPYSVVVGDVDGDGDLDLLTANRNSYTVSVRLNGGDATGSNTGTFANGSEVGVGNEPQNTALGDVDGDGDLDLLVANGGSNTVSVRLNDGAGTFRAPALTPEVAVGSNPSSVVVGDVDGDGDLDLLTANRNDNTVSVRLNGGTGVFAGGTTLAGGMGINPISVVLGDVDGDGDLDALTTFYDYYGTVRVLLNGGDATGSNTGLFANGSTVAVGLYPTNVAVGDVDGDGDLDLLTVNSNDNTVSVRLNGGNATGSNTGVFANGSDPAVGNEPQSLAVGDVDGDGDLDLLTANRLGPHFTVSVRLNGGNATGSNTGIFAGGTDAALGNQPIAIALGDVDGDGDLDALTTADDYSSYISPVSVLLNQPLPPTLTSIAPPSGPAGTVIGLTGTNFTGATSIRFNGAAAGTFSVTSATTATATVPAGATTGNVTLTTLGGTTNGVVFTVLPALTSFTPTGGLPGTVVTLTGTAFTGATGVSFNGVPTTGLTVSSATSLTAYVPVGATTGLLSVSTAAGTGTSAAAFTVAAIAPDVVVAVTPAGPLSACGGPTLTAAATLRPFLPTGTGLNNRVAALAVQPDGKLLLGGLFTTYNGAAAPYVIRLNADGSRDASFALTGTGLNSFVYAVAVQPDGKLLLGGYFTTYNGVAAPYIIRLNADGSRDASFAPPGSGLSDGVGALAVQPDGKLLLGGSFTTYNGAAAKYVIRLNADGSRDAAFAPTSTGLGSGNSYGGVNAVAVQPDGKLLLGGSFNSYDGAAANYVVRLNADGSRDAAFAPPGTGPNADVVAVAVQPDGKLLLGGFFTSYNGATANRVLRLNADGSRDASFAPASAGLDNYPFAVAVQPDGKLLLGGVFTTYNGAAAKYVTRLNADGSRDAAFAPPGSGLSNAVEAVAVQPDGKLLLGGFFTSYNGAVANRVIRLKADGTPDATVGGAAGATYAWTPGGSAGATVVPALTGGSYQATATVGGYTFGSNTVRVTACIVTITSFTPTSGPVGTVISLTGTNLTGATAITFTGTSGNVVTTGFTVASATSITGVVVPSGAVTGTLTVTTPGGTSAASSGSFTVTLPAPTISSAADNPVARGGLVMLNGTGLAGATGVTFARSGFATTTISTFSSNTATALAFALPLAAPNANGAYDVTVTNANGTSAAFSLSLTDNVAWNGSAGTAWATATNWSPPAVPNTYLNTTITAAAAQPTVTGTQLVQNVTVQAGASLTLAATTAPTTQLTLGTSASNNGSLVLASGSTLTQGAGSELYITQNMTNNGATFVLNATSEIGFGGPSHVLNGTAGVTFQTLTVGEQGFADYLSIQVPVQVRRKLGVYNSSTTALGAGGSLTLLSDATGTALVDNTGGTVGGTVTVQRYIDPSLNAGAGYRHFSSPVANTTVSDLTTAGFAPTLTTSYNASATPGTTTPFPTVFGYDQSRVSLANSYAPFDRGFVVPAALSTPLTVGQGYAVNIAGNQLVDFVGTLTTGNQSPVALSRVAGNPDAGWQLLGNPYPAPLDYALVAPADRVNLDGAIYVYGSTGPYVGTYRSYVNGVGGNSVLPVAQGFFARLSAGQTSGALTFRNSQRLTAPNATAFQRATADTRPLVQLELRGSTGNLADALYAYAETGATPAFDSQFDAEKLPNPTGLNLSSTATSGQRLAIDGRPAFTAATVLPLTLGVPAAGTYTLSAAALTQLPAGLDAYLHDAVTGQTINLGQQPRYAFAVSPAQAQAGLSTRFSLGFSPQAILATHAGLHAGEVSLFPNPAHDSFTVLVPAVTGTSQLRAELLNALGQVVRRLDAALPADGASLHVDTAGLAGGVYILRLSAGPTTLTKRVVLH